MTDLYWNLVLSLIVIWGCILGGESTADNCQILQTRVNRFKSDKEMVDKTQLQGYSCDVKFTGIFALFIFLRFLQCIVFCVTCWHGV